ncbi:MAG: hypothetical protein B7733_10565 [Myxococcales bacterium FL481]|nr:MAG: hypothetical protein B7733_10565 [Myxococcales bacterium FL481]
MRPTAHRTTGSVLARRLITMPTPNSSTDNTRDSASVAATATELAALAEELGLDSVAKQIREHAVRRLSASVLRVAVLGEVNHGKSSLINALVEADVLPTSAVPTTRCAVAVRTGDESGYFVGAGAGRRPLSRTAFDAAVRAEGVGGEGLEVVRSPNDMQLPPHVELFDTPGLNDVGRFHEAVARRELPGADVIVLVLDATQVLTRTERHSLDDALAALGGSRSGVVFELVINRIDLVAEHERALIVEHVREQLLGLPFETLEPYLTDARREAPGRSEDSFGTQEVQRLRTRLAQLAQLRDELLPQRAVAELRRQAELLAAHAEIHTRASRLDADVLADEIAGVRRALADGTIDIDALRASISERCDAIVAASHDRIEEHRQALVAELTDEIRTADLRQLSETVPGATREAHLQFARGEADRIRDALEQLTHDILATHGEHARRRLYRTTLALGFRGPAVHIEPPSGAIEVGTLALGAVGTVVMYFGSFTTGMLMAIASPLTHVLLRERTIRRARAQATASIPDAVAQTVQSLQTMIERVVQDHRQNLEKYLAGADQALAEQLVAVLTHAQQVTPDLPHDHGKLSNVEQRLRRLRVALAPAADSASPPPPRDASGK